LSKADNFHLIEANIK